MRFNLCLSKDFFEPDTKHFAFQVPHFKSIEPIKKNHRSYTMVLKLLPTEIRNLPARKNVFLHGISGLKLVLQ